MRAVLRGRALALVDSARAPAALQVASAAPRSRVAPIRGRARSVLMVLTLAAHARADDLFDDGPRGLIDNPAALARRAVSRASFGLTLSVDARTLVPSGALAAQGASPAVSRAGAVLLPWGGLVVGVGDDVTIGAVVLRDRTSFAYLEPPSGAGDDRFIYPHRYGGTRMEWNETSAALGVAWRARPWLALGISAEGTHLSLTHAVTVYGGDASAGEIGELDPATDMAFAVAAKSAPVARFTLGAVAAPPDLPLEIAVGGSMAARAHVEGSPVLTDARGSGVVGAAVARGAVARLELPASGAVRAGIRLVLSRIAVWGDFELRLGKGALVWEIEGVSLIPVGGEAIALSRVPLGEVARTVSAGVGAEAAVVPGFLTLWASYRFETGPAPTVVWPGGDAHALGGGATVRAGALAVGVWVSHRFLLAADAAGLLVAPRRPDLALPAAPGTVSGGTTQAGVNLTWDL